MAKKRTFKDFTREQVANIATEYANSSCVYTESHFTAEYNISTNTFYSIIHNAVSRCMVSDEIAIKIRDKACNNSRAVAGSNASVRSFRTYQRLFKERESYSFNEKDSIMYAKKFAQSNLSLIEFCNSNAIIEKLLVKTLLGVVETKQVDNETIELIMDKIAKYYTIQYSKKALGQSRFCEKYPVSKALLGKLVQRAIIRNLVSENVVIIIRNNAFKWFDPDEVYEFFSRLERERIDFINGSKEAL